jgi:4-amino-4-deoxy-L-arabinose transferase-like glycosyltransferase
VPREQSVEKLAGTPRIISDTAADNSGERRYGIAALHITFLFALAGFTSWLGYVGFIASDDGSYSEAAIGWLRQFPYVGATHWGLRHTVVLPVTLSFWLGGINEVSMMLPTKIYLLLLILLTYGCLSRVLGYGTALLSSAFIAATPIFILPSSPSDDLPECLFVAASFWAFYFGSEARNHRGLLLLSGICAGLGFVTRETSAIISVFYGILFLLGRRIGRPYYCLILAGFLVIITIDTVYLASMTGDPLYRFHISIRGVSSDNPLDVGTAAAAPIENGLDRFGLIAVPRVIKPILMLFSAHEFGPLFFLVIPAGLWLWKTRRRREPQFEIPRFSALLGLIWFLALSYVMLMLWPVPRYYSVVIYSALIIVALWLRALSLRRTSVGLIAVLTAGNLLMIYLDNKGLMFGERTLVALAGASDEPIYTDPATLRGANFLLEYTVPGHKVVAGLAPAGGLFFYNPFPLRTEGSRDSASKFKPGATWILVRALVEEPKLSARLLRASGLEAVLPVGVARKLDPPPHRCYLYRFPPR